MQPLHDENSAHDTTQITGPSKAVARKKSPETRALKSVNRVFQQGAIQHAAEDPPTIGMTQNSHSCCSAQPRKIATAVLRAG